MNQVKKYLYIILGTICCILGVVGIFVPLLPTTPFLLLSAALYVRSSPQLYQWLMSHPQLGPYIRHFREDKALPLRVKVVSVSLVWFTMLYAVFALIDWFWLQIILLLLAAAVSAYILHFKTLKKIINIVRFGVIKSKNKFSFASALDFPYICYTNIARFGIVKLKKQVFSFASALDFRYICELNKINYNE